MRSENIEMPQETPLRDLEASPYASRRQISTETTQQAAVQPKAKIGKTPSLTAQSLMIAASTGIGQVVTALMYIWAARSISPADFGPIVAAIALGTTLAGFLDFGSNSLWVRELAKSTMSTGELGQKLANKLFVTGLVLAVWLVVFLSLPSATMIWVAAPVGFAFVLNQSMVVPLRGAGRGDLLALVLLTDRMLAAAIFCVFMGVKAPSTSALVTATVAGPLLSGALSRYALLRPHQPPLKWPSRLNPWKGAGHFGISSSAVSAQTLDLTIMNVIGGPAVAGLYGAVSRWTQPMNLLAGSFTTAAAPVVARAESWSKAWPQVKRSAWLVLGAVFICGVVATFADGIVELLIGSEYDGSGPVLRILALGTIGSVVNQPMAAFLQALGRDRIVSSIITSGVLVQLGLVAVLTWTVGATGAAISFCGLQFLICLLLVISISSKIRPNRRIARHRRIS